MEKKTKKDITLGIFVVIGLLIFIAVLYYIGSREQLFGSQVKVVATFKNISGLQPGNNVHMSGIKVGTVSDVSIATDSTVNIVMKIEQSASRFIKRDAVATVASDGLMGNKIVSLAEGSAEARSIENMDTILTKEPVSIDDIINTFNETSEQARDLIENLVTVSSRIKNSEGLLGMVISDTTLVTRVEGIIASVDRTSKNAADITGSIEKAARNLNEGDGLLAKLIHDDRMGNNMAQAMDSIMRAGENLASVSRDLKTFTTKLSNEQGVVGKLVNDSIMGENLKETIYNVRKGTENLDQVVSTINESWLLNIFSGNKKKKRQEEAQLEGHPAQAPEQ
jgi:phospholipid/cholesterol/gamma-HCH transport system substrate-binding protein